MHMTLRRLRVFEAVARHLSCTRAADELRLSQPAVSLLVRQLEDTARRIAAVREAGKKIHLTEAGREFFHYGPSIVHQLRELNEVIEALQGERSGHLRLTVATPGNYFASHPSAGGVLPALPGNHLLARGHQPQKPPEAAGTQRNRSGDHGRAARRTGSGGNGLHGKPAGDQRTSRPPAGPQKKKNTDSAAAIRDPVRCSDPSGRHRTVASETSRVAPGSAQRLPCRVFSPIESLPGVNTAIFLLIRLNCGWKRSTPTPNASRVAYEHAR